MNSTSRDEEGINLAVSLPTDRPFSNNPNSMRITDDKHSAKSNSALDMARQALYRFAAIELF